MTDEYRNLFRFACEDLEAVQQMMRVVEDHPEYAAPPNMTGSSSHTTPDRTAASFTGTRRGIRIIGRRDSINR